MFSPQPPTLFSLTPNLFFFELDTPLPYLCFDIPSSPFLYLLLTLTIIVFILSLIQQNRALAPLLSRYICSFAHSLIPSIYHITQHPSFSLARFPPSFLFYNLLFGFDYRESCVFVCSPLFLSLFAPFCVVRSLSILVYLICSRTPSFAFSSSSSSALSLPLLHADSH